MHAYFLFCSENQIEIHMTMMLFYICLSLTNCLSRETDKAKKSSGSTACQFIYKLKLKADQL